jgi:TRAP-type C4-dicarboxylate transport system substrate-binding protein
MRLNRRQLLAAGAALTLAAPTVSRAQAREFRLGILTPTGHPWNNAALRVAEALRAESSGRLTLNVFHAGQLGNEGAMLQQMQSGALDFGWIMTAELGSRVPAIAAINAPFLVDSTEKIGRLVRHPAALKLFDVLPRETGTVGLAWGITGMRAIFAARDLNSLADIRGMKLRIIPTPVFRDFYQMLGAAPTPIPTPQVFDAMTNGQVDGLEADLDFSWNQRFDRVSRTILRMNAMFMPVVALASGRVWQGVSPADRELIGNITRRELGRQVDELAANEPRLLEEFGRTNVPIRTATAADAAAIIAEFDRQWLPRAPNIAELRAAAATL